MTELGDAEYFAAVNADIVRYDHRRGIWLLFTGHRWTPQTHGQVARLAFAAMRARQSNAFNVVDDDKRRAAVRWTMSGESRARLVSLLALAQNLIPIADAGDQWDKDAWLLGVQNGVIDLKTGTLRDGIPEDRITKCCNVEFDPLAKCRVYDETLAQIFEDSEMRDYWHRFTGYSITGDCREEVFAICWGEGGNGKGTLINTIAWTLGDYADDLPFSSLELQDRSSIPTDLAKIDGKRFVTASETSASRRLNEARIKALTGRDQITARFMHKDFFTFTPVAKFWLSTNPKPKVVETTNGFWRRVHMIPFEKTFNPPNLELKDQLKLESAGILVRLVEGCLAWQARGLQKPAAVLAATEAYRDESTPLTEFIEERCITGSNCHSSFGELFAAYQNWCGDTRDRRMSRTQFSVALHARYKTDPSEKRNVVFVGIGLLAGGDRGQM